MNPQPRTAAAAAPHSPPPQTPWGRFDSCERIASGVYFVSTPSHGGYWLSPERRAEVDAKFPGFETFAGGNWFEEDQDWSVVCLAMPYLFPPEAYERARRTSLRRPDPALVSRIRGWRDRYAVIRSTLEGGAA